MANHYDKILKENLEEIFIPLTEKLLGISLENAQELPDAIQITLEREPDLLKKIDDKYILQVEFQTADDPMMLDRMFVYLLCFSLEQVSFTNQAVCGLYWRQT